VLEAAVAVAREGERATPPQPAPGPLRRYLSFARLPDPALEVARRVLDDDEAFRARVAGAVEEQVVGRAGWVFLTRPDGWQAEVDGLRQAAAAQELSAKEERAEREAMRRLAGAEAAAARAEAAAVSASAEADRLRAELDDTHAVAESLADEVDALRADVERLASERTAAIRRLKEAEASLATRGAEVRELRHELRMVQAELGQMSPAVPAASEAAGAAPDAPEVAEPGVDRDALGAALADARTAADSLSSSLAAAASLLGPPDTDPQGAEAEGAAGAAPAASRGRHVQRRRPVAPPPGMHDDTPAAAEHLVRTPGVLVLVDGYNISHAQWYGMPPAEQRTRLLDACAELHARVGVDVEVVFDGTGDEPSSGSLVRAAVRYRFTPAGVEADDVILARVDEEPRARPVIVVSSDRRVREGARLRGANVFGARQFLALLRR
jgi:predicted RNA-binding protein with PIN domain